MPAVVIPAVIAAGAPFIFTGAPFVLSAFLTNVAIYSGLALLSGALARRPDNPSFTSESRDRMQVVRSAVAERRIVYGQVMVSGPLVYAESTGANNDFLHLVIPLAGHEVEEIGEVYLNDTAVGALDGNGFAENAPWGTHVDTQYVNSGVVPGTPFQVTIPTTVQSVIQVSLQTTDTTEAQGWRTAIDVSPSSPSSLYEYSRSGSTFTFHSSAANSFNYLIVTYQRETTSHVRVKKHLGTTDQAADADLVAESAGLWTNNHRLRGVAYVYIRLKYHADVFPTGIPNIRAVVKGKKVYDPRGSITAWSTNWALCVRDYLTSDYGLDIPDAEIDEASVTAAANICDEPVELTSESPSSYQLRYRCNGTVNLGDRPVEILREMVTAAAGTVTFSQGVWRILAGAYQTPTVTINEDWLRAPVEMQARRSRRDLFNVVRGKFSNPSKFWQLTDFPAIGNTAYALQDGGDDIVRDVELPFTTDEIAAQRIAKIHLEKSRQGITVKLPCNLRAFQVGIWDTVRVTIDDLGWSAKDFIVLNWAMSQDGNGVDLTLQEEASTAYDWNAGLATVQDSAPDTLLPSPFFTVPTPGAPTFTEELYETRDGRGVANRLTVTWTQPAYPYPLQYQLEYTPSPTISTPQGAAVYTVLPTTRDNVVVIPDVASGYYDLRVRAVNLIGVASEYAVSWTKEVVGLAAPPSAPTGVSLQIAGGTVIISLTRHPELDVLRGGRILVRHTEETTAQSWEESLSIGAQDSWPGDSVLIIVPSKAGSYLLKARDSTGQESAAFAVVTTKQASILAFGSAGTIQEDSTFPGTHSDTTVVGVTIEIVQDGSPTGPVKSSGTYTFSTGFNFGSVKRVRVTTVLQGVVYNAQDLIDDRTTLIDSWQNFDGDVGFGSSGDAWVEVRESDDTSSPTEFGEWKRVDAGEFEAKLMQFRLQLRSFDSAYNVAIDTLRVRAEEVV